MKLCVMFPFDNVDHKLKKLIMEPELWSKEYFDIPLNAQLVKTNDVFRPGAQTHELRFDYLNYH